MEIAYNSKAGFTLIELMISIMILMVGILGLLQMVNVSISHGLSSKYRNEAVAVADEVLLNQQARGYDQIVSMTNYSAVHRPLLSAYKNYSVVTTGSVVSANTKQVNVTVSWVYKKIRYTQQAATLISKIQ